MTIPDRPPNLYVEGAADISVVSGLLLRHGLNTEKGKKFLCIKNTGNVKSVLEIIPEVIRASTSSPVGFIIDIDIQAKDRWSAVKAKLKQADIDAPDTCPASGYLGNMPGYPYHFGIWLMPDCITDHGKIEHLVSTLIPDGEPLWPHAISCVQQAITIVDNANRDSGATRQWERFRDVDRIKSEIYTWLSWQICPDTPLGGAITRKILGHDSAMAMCFLKWLAALYGFEGLAGFSMP
ncbi:MAG TPA: DUF3226 domain-containing protein [Pirellulales bacterium]|nr:DUF3226 domain-containing protein [Pirellulales bacterium]